jgi:hypothetical protein
MNKLEDLEELFKEYELSASEIALVNYRLDFLPSKTDIASRSNIIAELILAKTIQRATKEILASNKALYDSNNRYSRRTLGLTRGLVFIGTAKSGQACPQVPQFC